MGICAIWGAPQTGKTTLAVNLAHAASRGDETVCLISPETYSETSAILGMGITEEHSLQAALQGHTSIKQTVAKADELFFVLAALNKADTVVLTLGGHISCVMWYAAYKRALQAVRSRAVYVSLEITPAFDYDAMHQLLKCSPEIRIPYIRDASVLQNENKFLYQQTGKRGKAYSRAINRLYEVIRT